MMNYSEEEITRLQAPLAMLSKYAQIILPIDKKMELATINEVAEELLPWIPPAMYQGLEDLAKAVKSKGPELLRLAHPLFMSGRWPDILTALGEIIIKDDENI